MSLIEINNLIRGKFGRNPEVVKRVYAATEEDVQLFRELLAISDSYVGGLQQTESAKDFYSAYEIFSKCIPKEAQEDVFYANKVGYIYEGVPSKLVYIINKALKTYDTPNVAISSVDARLWQKYLKKGALGEDVIVKDVIDRFYSKNVELISSSKLKVQATDELYEIYVANKDRVVVVPKDIADAIESIEDLNGINYKEGIGVCLFDMPLRTFNGRLGITNDEFDLRECQ